ncbi:sugar phosphate isomerase/epimerase family protein [Paenibacillus sp. NPDC058071]|uniref:sugar phosphate isomerase/epimerase family protein n=1 Tax=Paenibacillus sp. NPDC058071 TaxID=3346326 RepID=UPI0036DD9D10
MNYHLCTISFRHELVSFRQLLRFACRAGFSGIELWGVHGLALLRRPAELPELLQEMKESGIRVAMVSDYLNLNAAVEDYAEVERKWEQLIRLAVTFGAGKIRIFAGQGSSEDATLFDWERVAGRLRGLAARAFEVGIHTLIETHPDTYADRLDAAVRLIGDVDYPGLGVNLDFLHLWESGTSPKEAWETLKPYVKHLHLKNVQTAEQLHVFAPGNVYSPSGERSPMVPLASGAVEYLDVLHLLAQAKEPLDASLEWFGNGPFRYLLKEMAWLKRNGLLSERAELSRNPATVR